MPDRAARAQGARVGHAGSGGHGPRQSLRAEELLRRMPFEERQDVRRSGGCARKADIGMRNVRDVFGRPPFARQERTAFPSLSARAQSDGLPQSCETGFNRPYRGILPPCAHRPRPAGEIPRRAALFRRLHRRRSLACAGRRRLCGSRAHRALVQGSVRRRLFAGSDAASVQEGGRGRADGRARRVCEPLCAPGQDRQRHAGAREKAGHPRHCHERRPLSRKRGRRFARRAAGAFNRQEALRPRAHDLHRGGVVQDGGRHEGALRREPRAGFQHARGCRPDRGIRIEFRPDHAAVRHSPVLRDGRRYAQEIRRGETGFPVSGRARQETGRVRQGHPHPVRGGISGVARLGGGIAALGRPRPRGDRRARPVRA